jgi:hypothetical protein
MMMPRILHKAPFLRTLAAAGAVGLAMAASMALAQTNTSGSGDSGAGAANPNKGGGAGAAAGAPAPGSVSGVTVEAPPRPDHAQIPPDKKAAYDAEVAKAEAWKSYRGSLPPLSDGTFGQAKDYPGAQSLLPHPEEPSEGR